MANSLLTKFNFPFKIKKKSISKGGEFYETVLVKVAYLIEVEDDLYQGTITSLEDGSQAISYKFSEQLDQFESNVSNAVPDQLIIDPVHTAFWQSTQMETLEPQYTNCGQCSLCGAWTTDCEKVHPIEELANGATVNEKLY